MSLNPTIPRTATGTSLLREVQETVSDLNRYKDICLFFRRRKTGEKILQAGGRWDYLTRTFVGPEVTKQATFHLEESQVEFARWFSQWLTAYVNKAPRDTRLVLTAGERRGGKTTAGLISLIAAVLAVPGTIAWAVSSTFQERDELEQAILRFIPSHWYVYRGAPKYRYVFPNGSVLRNVSADDPDVLKQGRVDIVLVNEAQKMQAAVLTNLLPAVIDRGGLVLLAANPPRRAIGAWVTDLKEALDAKRLKAAKFFGFSAKLNESIDQEARQDIGDILRVIDPKVAAADDEGLWLAVGDAAYTKFQTNTHVKPRPQLGDVTREVTKQKFGRPYDFISGNDFQQTPHNATVILKVFKAPDGRNIYWAVGEVLREGTEDDLIDSIEEAGYTPENLVAVGDASAGWQNAAHTQGRNSFEVFKSRRFHIHPPRKAKDETRKPSNPPIEDRLNLVNNLLAQGRLFVDPDGAPRLATALKKCEFKHWRPYGKYAHETDALGYALWKMEPEPSQRGGRPATMSVKITRGNGF